MLVPIVRYYTIQGGKERIHEEGRRCYHRPDDPLLFNRHSSLNPCAHLRSLFDVELLLFTYAVFSTPGTTPGLTYRRTRSDHHNDANPPGNCVIIVWTFGTRSNSSGHNLCTYPISCCHSVSFHQFPSINCPNFLLFPSTLNACKWLRTGYDTDQTIFVSYLNDSDGGRLCNQSFLTRSLQQGRPRRLKSGLIDI
jgi:hypothetical protein